MWKVDLFGFLELLGLALRWGALLIELDRLELLLEVLLQVVGLVGVHVLPDFGEHLVVDALLGVVPRIDLEVAAAARILNTPLSIHWKLNIFDNNLPIHPRGLPAGRSIQPSIP
jgi:hypothetical protein